MHRLGPRARRIDSRNLHPTNTIHNIITRTRTRTQSHSRTRSRTHSRPAHGTRPRPSRMARTRFAGAADFVRAESEAACACWAAPARCVAPLSLVQCLCACGRCYATMPILLLLPFSDCGYRSSGLFLIHAPATRAGSIDATLPQLLLPCLPSPWCTNITICDSPYCSMFDPIQSIPIHVPSTPSSTPQDLPSRLSLITPSAGHSPISSACVASHWRPVSSYGDLSGWLPQSN